MKNLRRIGASSILALVLSLSAFAGEMNAPPCSPPEPGQTSTPPCTGGQMASDSSELVSTPSASDAGYLVAEAAVNLFESLPLF